MHTIYKRLNILINVPLTMIAAKGSDSGWAHLDKEADSLNFLWRIGSGLSPYP